MLDLNIGLTSCDERIKSLKASHDDLKDEYKKDIVTQRNRSFTRVNIFLEIVLLLISAILGAIIVKFLPS